MMEQISEQAIKKDNVRTRRTGIVCPSLVLAAKAACDKWGPLHEMSRSQMLEYCTTELHCRCSRWTPSTMPHEAAR